jgi:hypothetical protein
VHGHCAPVNHPYSSRTASACARAAPPASPRNEVCLSLYIRSARTNLVAVCSSTNSSTSMHRHVKRISTCSCAPSAPRTGRTTITSTYARRSGWRSTNEAERRGPKQVALSIPLLNFSSRLLFRMTRPILRGAILSTSSPYTTTSSPNARPRVYRRNKASRDRGRHNVCTVTAAVGGPRSLYSPVERSPEGSDEFAVHIVP